MANNQRVYKVALCGKSGVGKTSIFHRIRGKEFREDTATFEHLGHDKVNVDVRGNNIEISLWDTAGLERHSDLTRQHYHGSQVVLFVYDCDNIASVEAIRGYYRDALEHTTGAAMVLVRNKIDREDQSLDVAEVVRNLCTHRAARGETDSCKFAFVRETSAQTNEGIQELFQVVADYLLRNAEAANHMTRPFEIISPQNTVPLTEADSQPSSCSC